jgi:hypothetical protein
MSLLLLGSPRNLGKVGSQLGHKIVIGLVVVPVVLPQHVVVLSSNRIGLVCTARSSRATCAPPSSHSQASAPNSSNSSSSSMASGFGSDGLVASLGFSPSWDELEDAAAMVAPRNEWEASSHPDRH